MKKLFLWGFLLCLLLPLNLMAATEAQKQAAIDAGLEYLASTQLAGGGWDYGPVPDDTAATGAALLSFLEEGYTAGTDVVINATNYGDVVGDGLNYLFSQASIVAIGPQTYGNPDSNGNGQGVKFVLGGNNSRDTYTTGLVLPAIASTGTPGAVVTVGALAGRTYQQVVQDTVDYFAFGQEEAGSARGGWRYWANSNTSDNSTAQWPVIGTLFAGKMGVSAPAFVKSELDIWNHYIQYLSGTPGTGLHGSSGYNVPLSYNNQAKTGGLLVEMDFVGDGLSDPRMQAALDYIDREWLDGPSGTWYGNFGHPYAMWSVYKGLEVTVGLDDTTWITNLHPQGAALLDAGDTWNWWEDYCEYLVNTQSAGGNWGGYSYWNNALATAWNINILAATEIPGGEVPEPATLLLLGSGLMGMGVFARRKKKK